MPDTVVGLFRTRAEADQALGKHKGASFGPDQVAGLLISMAASGDPKL